MSYKPHLIKKGNKVTGWLDSQGLEVSGTYEGQGRIVRHKRKYKVRSKGKVYECDVVAKGKGWKI